jgi:hypothetical protein
LPKVHSRRLFSLTVSGFAIGIGAAALVPVSANASSPQDPFIASPAAVASIQNSWSAVPQYATAPVLDTGHLVDSTEQAVSGATVIVFPVPKVTEADQPLTPVARATTDSDGNYTLHLPTSQQTLLQNAGDADSLNLHIIAFYPGGIANWFMPAPLDAATPTATVPVAVATPTATIPTPTTATTTPPAQSPATTELTLQQLPAGNAATALAAVSATPAGVPSGCYIVSHTENANVPLVVGYKSNAKSGDVNYSQYTYTSEADQTTGVGISLNAANTGFSVNGTTTHTSGVTIPFPQINGSSNNYFTVNSTWDNDTLACLVTGFSWTEWYYALNSVNTERGTPGTPAVAAGYCSTEAGGVAISYTTTTQSEWSTGASVSSYIGINLSSQDGWTGSSALTYDLKGQAPICGVDNYPNANNPSAGYLQTH